MAKKVSPNTTPDPEGDLKFLEDAIASKEENTQINKEFALHLHGVWTRNQEDNKRIRQDMIATLRRVKGEYAPKKLSAIRAFRGSETYLREVEKKARSAVSWIEDIYQGENELPWKLDPTSLVDLPDQTIERINQDVMYQTSQLTQRMAQAGIQVPPTKMTQLIREYHDDLLDKERARLKRIANERCERATVLIRDQNQEGNWDSTFKDFLYYFVRLKYSVIKGPVLKRKTKQVWNFNELTQKAELVAQEELVMDCYCVSPFNFYPTRGMKNINDGDIIEIHELSKDALYKMIGVPGYSDIELRAILAKLEAGKIQPRWFQIDDERVVKQVNEDVKDGTGTSTFGQMDGQPSTQTAKGNVTKILAQEFFGTVSGKMLLDWGSKEKLDPQRQYQANAWRIGSHVFKAVVNPDNLGRKPYHISSWAKNPEWIIGEGLVEFGGPIEDAMNAVMRATINNVGIASGPLCEIDKDRVDMRTPLYPWRQIESTSDMMSGQGPAVNYYQPNMHVNELTKAYMFFSQLLDDMTVPAYAQGASQQGVTSGTATVFTQLLAAAARSIKAVVSNIDNDVIKPYIEMCYDYNMKFSDDESIKGDARVIAQGVTGLQAREQAAQKKVEFLQVMANPTYQQILGQENIGYLIADVAKSQNIKLPDASRLNGEFDISEKLESMLMAQAGVDPNQVNGQMSAGGGAPTAPKGTLPSGEKAGVVL